MSTRSRAVILVATAFAAVTALVVQLFPVQAKQADHGGFTGDIKSVLYVSDVESSAQFFDEVLGFEFLGLTNLANGSPLSPNLAGWSHFAGFSGSSINYFNWSRIENGVTRQSTVYSTTQMVDDALAWIAQAPEPWLVYLAFNAPHSPWHAPPHALHTQRLQGLPSSPPTPFYKAMVEALDTEIGRLCSMLGPHCWPAPT